MGSDDIRLLEGHVVDQIAAGEVVERPASVVKELVENALDAGAHQIDVTLKEGGSVLIQVADDGVGMSPQDALLSIERHATSKIRAVDDLHQISSFGFRGEALPSIAAVSRFELLTRPHDAEEGTRVRLEGGTLVDVRQAAAAPGTIIRARSLFFNLPARRAFLRAVSTELGHCVQAVVRLALGRPDVGFTLTHGAKRVVDAPLAPSLSQRAADTLGPDARHLAEIDASEGSLRLTGLAAPPGVHRASTNGASYLFVNGRWVRDLVLRRAIQHAYRDLVPRGRHPVVVLELRCPGESVDVNVHPTKAEVRFADPALVASFVSRALRAAVLDAAGRADPRPSRRQARSETPALPFDGDAPPAQGRGQGAPPQRPRRRRSDPPPALPPLPPDLASGPPPSTPGPGGSSPGAPGGSGSGRDQPGVDRATPDRATPDRATPDRATPDRATPDQAALGELGERAPGPQPVQRPVELTPPGGGPAEGSGSAQPRAQGAARASDPQPAIDVRAGPVAVELSPSTSRSTPAGSGGGAAGLRPVPARPRILGVVGQRWIVADREGALWLTDGGRLRRRAESARASAPGRRLLAPAVIRLPQAQVEAIDACSDELSAHGLDVARFSPTEIAVRAVPNSLIEVDPAELVEIALIAVKRGEDVRAAWGEGLSPAVLDGDVVALAALIEDAEAAGVPIDVREIDLGGGR
ncbi:MAG TPA: DNA mismatch repair endonuclease MutL [Deltaproteobacteria bacterium]|nr:DNA mismatch repair endonuclease MutL [Deltaproteobacteria bacterium]